MSKANLAEMPFQRYSSLGICTWTPHIIRSWKIIFGAKITQKHVKLAT